MILDIVNLDNQTNPYVYQSIAFSNISIFFIYDFGEIDYDLRRYQR